MRGAELSDFLGTWRAENPAPFSTHIFTWALADDGLRGEWILEGLKRVEMPIVEPTYDEGRVLFKLKGSPYFTEFRIVDGGYAVMGAPADRIPPELSGPEYRHSIESHRVRLHKVPTTTA